MYDRTKRQEIYLRASTNFHGENMYYENAETADVQVTNLARDLAVHDWEWTAGFLIWLRSEAQIRTMSIALAAEAVHERLGSSMPGSEGGSITNRQLIGSVLQRPDEPAEMVALWTGKWGRAIPKPVKRGVADAVTRMYSQRQALRWDKPGDPVRMGDVIELVHPKMRKITTDGSADKVQGALYSHLITARHDRDGYVPDPVLGAVRQRDELNRMSPQARHDFAFKALDGKEELDGFKIAMAGSWEWARSWMGEK